MKCERERERERDKGRESDRESKQWKVFCLLKSDQVTSKANTRDLSTKKSGNRRGTKENEIRNFGIEEKAQDQQINESEIDTKIAAEINK